MSYSLIACDSLILKPSAVVVKAITCKLMCARLGLQIQFLLGSLPYSRVSLKDTEENYVLPFLLFTWSGKALHWLSTKCHLLSTSCLYRSVCTITFMALSAPGQAGYRSSISHLPLNSGNIHLSEHGRVKICCLFSPASCTFDNQHSASLK